MPEGLIAPGLFTNGIAEPLTYFATLALFGFVIMGSALIRHEMLLLACIPPVFVAAIMGFIMALYSGETFGWGPTVAAILLGAIPAWFVARRLSARDLLLTIYLTWAVALVLSLVGFGFPDRGE
ncbi:MAG TPA: hypothetical protein VFG62_18895 [Rhodopila sp.]|nr:hypothetical protein [Rhodopila sp.]